MRRPIWVMWVRQVGGSASYRISAQKTAADGSAQGGLADAVTGGETPTEPGVISRHPRVPETNRLPLPTGPRLAGGVVTADARSHG